MNKIPVVAVVGPTASGKTALAARIAKEYGGEVVSADSMQIYADMDIATAKPTEDEMLGVPHHMIGFMSPLCEYSVADYTALASKIIGHISRRGRLCVLCGGTGLYIDSLLDNIRFTPQSPDREYRDYLRGLANENGTRYLHDMLKELDPEAAVKISENDLVRIVRALEINKASGQTLREAAAKSRSVPSPYAPVYIGLDFCERQCLYDRINHRVDIMLQKGLIKEAEHFLKAGISKTAMNAIGYKELVPYFCGEVPLEECVELIKRDSRRYAKKQLTWFRRNKKINWIDAQGKSGDDVFCEAAALIDNNL